MLRPGSAESNIATATRLALAQLPQERRRRVPIRADFDGRRSRRRASSFAAIRLDGKAA